MAPLRILIFNWRCPRHPQAGGAEKATYEIAKRWVQKGHYVQIVSGAYKGGQKHDNIDGIRVTRVGGRYSVYLKSILHYRRRLEGKYDVVIDEINTIPYFTPLYAKEPHVAFIHQLAANVLLEELPWATARFWLFMEPRVLRLYKNTPIITSQGTKDDLLRIGIAERNIHVINYGVDHNVYKPGKGKSQYPHIFYLGRLKRFKGVHLIVRAMAQVIREIPNAKLSIVGSGDANYVLELARLVDNLNLSKNIDFYNFGLGDSIQQKVEIMQEAWALVFPSAREGFGLVVVEANACGTPTIAADVPGLRETVRDNDGGLLVTRSIDALANSIMKVLGDNELRGRLSQSAFEWSMQFDWDKTANNILQVLENAVSSFNRKK